jgi:hypothetical protein
VFVHTNVADLDRASSFAQQSPRACFLEPLERGTRRVDQSTRQNLVTAFNTLLRTSALVGKIDQQRTSLAFAALLQNLPDDVTVVPLGPIYDFLMQQKAPEAAVRETLVVLQSREARFNVRLELPPQLRSLSDEERAKIVLMASALAPSATNPGMRGVAASAAAAAAPAAPAAPTGFVPDKKKKGDGTSRTPLLVVLVVLIVAFAGSVAYNLTTSPSVPQSLKFDDPNGMPCAELFDGPTAMLCFVHDDFLAATPRDALKTRAEATRATAVARGLTKRPVQVLSYEKRTLVHVF